MYIDSALKSGAHFSKNGCCRFRVWAPSARAVGVHLVSPEDRTVRMGQGDQGWFQTDIEKIDSHARYFFRLEPHTPENGGPGYAEFPDPASRLQPEGVHGPSQVVPGEFQWHDRKWRGMPVDRYIIYELHVGTFTPEGTLASAVRHLDMLVELGVTAVELMPVAQFPGQRNWGYDGVYPFAVQHSYGGPEGLKAFVDACHARGLAVILDVVYNHLGPEGNYLRHFGPYFTDFYRTPWGEAINFDGPGSDHVRRYFTENALQWLDEFHIDALRLDAVHAVLDFSARPFLEELARTVHHLARRLNRRIHLIAESALNDTRIVRPREFGGFALDAQWNDDFHHALHTLLTGENTGYYQDFGDIHDLAAAWSEGFVYSGRYSPFRQRRYGNSSRNIPARRFVVFSQNHDQVGNRMRGDRPGRHISFEKLKLAAGAVLLSPFIPLIFMGEEYGENAPFQYFVSHGDPDLVDAVRRGRRQEFAAFNWAEEPPDPQDVRTFTRCVLDPIQRYNGRGKYLWRFYRELIRLRQAIPALSHLTKKHTRTFVPTGSRILLVSRWFENSAVVLMFNFSDHRIRRRLPVPPGIWVKRLDSGDRMWSGEGSPADDELISSGDMSPVLPPESCLLYERRKRHIIDDVHMNAEGRLPP